MVLVKGVRFLFEFNEVLVSKELTLITKEILLR